MKSFTDRTLDSYVNRVKRHDRDPTEIAFEKERDECTFRPQISAVPRRPAEPSAASSAYKATESSVKKTTQSAEKRKPRMDHLSSAHMAQIQERSRKLNEYLANSQSPNQQDSPTRNTTKVPGKIPPG